MKLKWGRRVSAHKEEEEEDGKEKGKRRRWSERTGCSLRFKKNKLKWGSVRESMFQVGNRLRLGCS